MGTSPAIVRCRRSPGCCSRRPGLYDTCIRYGGDEFVVLLSSCGRPEAEERRRLLQEAVAAISLQAEDGREISLRVSAGASVFPEDGETYERLLARADRRMYRNKAESKTPRPLLLTAGRDNVARLQLLSRAERRATSSRLVIRG